MKSDGLGVKRPYLYCTLWPHRRTSRPRVMETTKKLNGPFMGVGYLSPTGADAWSRGIERISSGVSRERSQ
jgi:hypothetical protein